MPIQPDTDRCRVLEHCCLKLAVTLGTSVQQRSTNLCISKYIGKKFGAADSMLTSVFYAAADDDGSDDDRVDEACACSDEHDHEKACYDDMGRRRAR